MWFLWWVFYWLNYFILYLHYIHFFKNNFMFELDTSYSPCLLKTGEHKWVKNKDCSLIFVVFINIVMNLSTKHWIYGETAVLGQVGISNYQHLPWWSHFQNEVHRTQVSLMSLVSFWIFVLVDMSTYLSPILTIMPPRIEGSDCKEERS